METIANQKRKLYPLIAYPHGDTRTGGGGGQFSRTQPETQNPATHSKTPPPPGRISMALTKALSHTLGRTIHCIIPAICGGYARRPRRPPLTKFSSGAFGAHGNTREGIVLPRDNFARDDFAGGKFCHPCPKSRSAICPNDCNKTHKHTCTKKRLQNCNILPQHGYIIVSSKRSQVRHERCLSQPFVAVTHEILVLLIL